MLWSIGLNIGSGYAELTAKSDGATVHSFKPIVSKGLDQALTEFCQENQIDEIADLVISSELSPYFFEKRLGASPAFIVTQGFEDWLTLNRTTRNLDFKNIPYYLDPNLTFGLSARIEENGEEIKALDQGEVSFIISKLKFENVSNVVVGLLHSSQNSKHEEAIKKELEKEGFHVLTSFNDPSAEDSPYRDEKVRWASRIKEAYLKSAYEEYFKPFINSDFFINNDLSNKIKVAETDKYGAFSDANWNLTEFTGVKKIANQLDSNIVYLGMEQWCAYINCIDESATAKNSTDRPEAFFSLPQPTKIIKPDAWGLPRSSKENVRFLPGPIAYGRGQNLTYLDLFFYNGYLKDSEFVPELTAKTKAKINEALFSLVPDRDSKDLSVFADELIVNELIPLLAQLSQSQKKSTICGPLSNGLSQATKNVFPKLNLNFMNEELWISELILDDFIGNQ